MKTKIAIMLLTASMLTLSGCFSDSGNSNDDKPLPENKNIQTSTYKSTLFSIIFPSAWDIIESKDFTAEIPRETILVIRNNIKNDTFTANINVVKNDLQSEISSLDYAKEVLNRQRTGLIDYKETRREIVKILVGGQSKETYYTEFEARLNSTDPILKFAQIYAVSGNSGYIVMGAWSNKENKDIIEQIISTIKSFKVN